MKTTGSYDCGTRYKIVSTLKGNILQLRLSTWHKTKWVYQKNVVAEIQDSYAETLKILIPDAEKEFAVSIITKKAA